MRDLVIDVVKIVAPLSVALIVFAQALGITAGQVAAHFRDRPGVMLRSLVATLILVPAAALGLILVFEPAQAVAVGLAILVACPPAPLMIKAAPKLGGGDAAYMASMHLGLAVLAVLTVPTVLNALSVPLGFRAEVDPLPLVWTLARTILLPIGFGLAVRALFPVWADAFAPRLEKAGSAGLMLVVLLALVAFYPALLNMDARSYGVIAAVAIAALTIGHVLGPKHPGDKTVLAVECAIRHPVLALTIGASNFTPQQALPVLVPCSVTFIAIAMAYLYWRGRTAHG